MHAFGTLGNLKLREDDWVFSDSEDGYGIEVGPFLP